MFKWIIRILIKPLLGAIKKGIELCDKVSDSMTKLKSTVAGLPLATELKETLTGNIVELESAIGTVRALLAKVLDYAGVDVPTAENDESVAEVEKSLKKLL